LISLLWCPARVGIPENEKFDQLAKEVMVGQQFSTQPQDPGPVHMPVSEVASKCCLSPIKDDILILSACQGPSMDHIYRPLRRNLKTQQRTSGLTPQRLFITFLPTFTSQLRWLMPA
jgi:hypothetical protein